MKPKSLIPLVVILAILVALVVVKQGRKPKLNIAQQAKLVSLLPEGLSKSDIGKLELYAGPKPEEKLVLSFDAEADKWRITSSYNAPVKQETIDKYLDALVKLKGEPRAKGVSDADLDQYDLADGKAFHVVAYKKDATDPLVHILVGKAPSYQSVFLRTADGKDVFVESANLRQQAGVSGEDMDKTPGAANWLDKDVLKIDEAKVTKVAFTLPDKAVVLERREKPKAEEKPAEGTEAQADTEKKTETPEKKEYEWVLASGGPGGENKTKSLDAIVQKLGSLMVTDIVDPAKKQEWGLEPAAYSCVVSIEGQEDMRIEGGRPDSTKDGYIRIASAKEDLVYSLNKYSFEQLFPKGTDFFELPGLEMDRKAIETIETTSPEGAVSLVKSADDKWTIAAPVADLKPQGSTLDSLAGMLAAWKPMDYADASFDVGSPVRTIKVTAAGQSHTIDVFGDSKHIDGCYVRLDGGATTLVMNRMDFKKAFPPMKDLFQRQLLDISEDDIAEIQVSSPASSFLLTRADEEWKLTVDGNAVDAKAEPCDDLATRVADLQATDILFGKAAMDAPADATIRFKMKAGEEYTLSFAPEKDGVSQMMLSGKAQAFTVSKEDRDNLFPAIDKLKKEEPPPAPAEPAPAPAEGTPAPAEPAPAPAEPAPAPAEGAPAPAEGTSAPAEGAPAPAEGAVVVPPAAVEIAPATPPAPPAADAPVVVPAAPEAPAVSAPAPVPTAPAAEPAPASAPAAPAAEPAPAK